MIRSHYLSVDYDVDSNLKIDSHVLFFIGVILISITFLLILLFICTRWASLRGWHSPPPSNSTAHAAAQKPALGLDAAAIDDIPAVTYGGSTAEDGAGAECCICLGVFDDADAVKILPRCRHCFHSECLNEWLKNQSSCPLCRCMHAPS